MARVFLYSADRSAEGSPVDYFRSSPPYDCTHSKVRGIYPQGADPPPPSSTRGKAGRNHLNEEITPLLPTEIGER